MIVTVHQPNYLPYFGFFHKMANADVLVLYDTAQFSKNIFHNRNRIKTPRGVAWITVPVRRPLLRPIGEIEIASTVWADKHRRTLEANYRRALYFSSYIDEISSEWSRPTALLAELNARLVSRVAGWLGIETEVVTASTLPRPATDDQTEKILHLVEACGGDTYLSGAGGKTYLDESKFTRIGLRYDRFVATPYPQQFGPFIANLSVVDAIFNCGESVASWLGRK